jgi:hypothetical protein
MRVLPYLLPALTLFAAVADGQAPAPATKTREEKTWEVDASLRRPLIKTSDFQQDMPLADFLAALQQLMPAEQRWKFGLDAEAFGKQLPALARTPVGHLPQVPRQLSPQAALENVLKQLSTPVDLRFGPNEVILTTPPRALFSRTYTVGDILQKWANLHADPVMQRFTHELESRGSDRLPHVEGVLELPRSEPDGKAVALATALVQAVDPPHWQRDGTMEVRNGSRLEVRTNWRRHEEISFLLGALRRLQDVAVVMDARLYEVDADFYAKHLEPRFKDARQSAGLRSAVPAGTELEALLAKQTLLLQGDDLKIGNNREAVFLSLQHAFTYPLPPPTNEEKARQAFLQEAVGAAAGAPGPDKKYRSLVEGVAFAARVEVSADRRRVRCQLAQKTAALALMPKMLEENIEKGTVPTADFPSVRKTTRTDYLDALDGMAFVVRVDYRPRAAQERQLVLWIAPRIYIEAEEEAIRRAQVPPK